VISKVQNYENNKKISFKSKYMPEKVAREFQQVLLDKTVRSVDLYIHSSPDDDAINSAMVVYHWLKKVGKQVSLCLNPEETKGLIFNPNKYNIKYNQSPADIAFITDCNSIKRIPTRFIESFKSQSEKSIIGIDHHKPEAVTRGDLYIDTTSRSCCEIIYMFMQRIGEKLSKDDLRNLYRGILSDYKKSNYIKITPSPQGALMKKLPELEKDTNAKKILTEIEANLSDSDKKKVYKYLNILSNLNSKEKIFRKWLSSQVKVTNSGELAYVIINPHEKLWASVGMDNARSSAILGELRSSLLHNAKKDTLFSVEQKKQFQNLQGAIIFYRTSKEPNSPYQISLTSKNGYAEKLITHIKTNLNPNLTAGGHANRAGGKIESLNESKINKFINYFLQAADKV
jgi:nanoRNase/pAp phosphatase (c-di-AMP/oligoRNAs hydrolase)